MQGWLNIQKLINVITHNRLKERKICQATHGHPNADKAFNKIQSLLMVKSLKN